jgi:hypothetical protein
MSEYKPATQAQRAYLKSLGVSYITDILTQRDAKIIANYIANHPHRAISGSMKMSPEGVRYLEATAKRIRK